MYAVYAVESRPQLKCASWIDFEFAGSSNAMVRERYMRRSLQLPLRELACGEVNPPICLPPGCAVTTRPQPEAFHSIQNIHQRLFDFVVTCR